MKQIVSPIFLLLLFLNSFSQKRYIEGTVIKEKESVSFKLLTIELFRNDSLVSVTYPDSAGHYIFSDLSNKKYALNFKYLGFRTVNSGLLDLEVDTSKNFLVVFPEHCKFYYPKNYTPRCPKGNTDSIVLIKYGLPNKKMMTQSKNGKIYLGGCIITDCDPKYYCKIHNIQF